jgi:hypothetical protein
MPSTLQDLPIDREPLGDTSFTVQAAPGDADRLLTSMRSMVVRRLDKFAMCSSYARYVTPLARSGRGGTGTWPSMGEKIAGVARPMAH